jgi:putative copper export protein
VVLQHGTITERVDGREVQVVDLEELPEGDGFHGRLVPRHLRRQATSKTRGVLSVTSDHVRLFLHVLAATIWVGGQFTLAGLLPVLRPLGQDATRAAARQFNRLAWPAFGVLLVTGIWNLAEVQVGDQSDEYLVTLFVKLAAVAVTGVGAAVHIVGRSKGALAVGGALTSIGAIASLFLGILLHS